MVLEILCVEPIYPQYSGVLEICLALRYWFFEVLGSESVKALFSEFCNSACAKNIVMLIRIRHTFVALIHKKTV